MSSTSSSLDGLVDVGLGSAEAAPAAHQELHDGDLMKLIAPAPGDGLGRDTAVAGSNDEVKDIHADIAAVQAKDLASSSSAGSSNDAMKGTSASAARKGAPSCLQPHAREEDAGLGHRKGPDATR